MKLDAKTTQNHIFGKKTDEKETLTVEIHKNVLDKFRELYDAKWKETGLPFDNIIEQLLIVELMKNRMYGGHDDY